MHVHEIFTSISSHVVLTCTKIIAWKETKSLIFMFWLDFTDMTDRRPVEKGMQEIILPRDLKLTNV
jgi:hypothetical protein